MEILIEDIPEEGLEVEATEKDPWFAGLIKESFGDAFADGDHAHLKARIERFDDNVNIDGEVEIDAHPNCDRCLKPYDEHLCIPFSTVLAPLYENERQQKMEEKMEVELVKEDLEFAYYEGDRFELDEVVREQVILDQPMKHVCNEDCRGLCPKCGKDLNEGDCGCAKEEPDARWAPLKDVKLPDRKH